jgi:hypothetical protein
MRHPALNLRKLAHSIGSLLRICFMKGNGDFDFGPTGSNRANARRRRGPSV